MPFEKAKATDPYYKLFNKDPNKFWNIHCNACPGKFSDDAIDLLSQMFVLEPK